MKVVDLKGGKIADLQDKLQELSDRLQSKIDTLLPQAHGIEGRVVEAMRYSSLSGGKRLRPFLLVTSASLFGVSRECSIYAAAGLEMVHSYSLIHDDLPAMDDDDLRRGQPSCHIKYDEATAILAGDGLLTYAFEVLADPSTHPNAEVRCQVIQALAEAAGCHGMVGGQMMDLAVEGKELEIDEIIRLQRLKTGEMFAVACEIGAILGRAPRSLRMALNGYAHALGLAFQITDDLLDAEGNREDTGKEVRKDQQAGKATLVSVMGIERAREQAAMLANQAMSHLEVFDRRADDLRDLARFVITRRG